MLFRLRNAAALALLALLAAAAPGTTEAHHHDKGLRGVVATDADKAAADDATKALTVTYPNPELHTNVWEDKRQGKWFSQTQVFLTNTAAKAICDVKVSVPLAKASDAKVSSSYAVDVEKTKSGLEGKLPDYIKRIEPNQMVNMGFMVEAASEDGVKLTDDVKVTKASFCDDN